MVKTIQHNESEDKKMNTTGINNHTADISQRNIARIAGFTFLFVLTGYTLSWIFVFSRLIVVGNATATANNIMANEVLFHFGIACDLLLAICGIILAWALYILVKPVNRNLALLALCLKLIDPILAIITVSVSFITLQMIHVESFSTLFKPEQLQGLAGLFLNLHTAASTVPMVFTGMGFIVFFYLLFKSKYVPQLLSGFGIFSYSLIFICSCINILGVIPSTSLLSNIEMICFAPSCLFELIIGLWLLFKNKNLQEKEE
jgi:hypothetical protein